MEDLIIKYVIEEALILIPALLILGKIIKKLNVIRYNYIPVILLVVGIGFAIAIMGFDVEAIIQGILVTGGAVFVHQLYKQIKETGQ